MEQSTVELFIEKWHELFKKDDPSLIDPLVHDDVVFYSPAIFAPKRGKETVLRLLKLVYGVFENYRVTDTWVRESEVIFEFEVEVGRYTLQGVDRFTLNDQGQIVQLTVWLRPLTAVKELARRVAAVGLEEDLARRGAIERLEVRARVRAAKLIASLQEGLR